MTSKTYSLNGVAQQLPYLKTSLKFLQLFILTFFIALVGMMPSKVYAQQSSLSCNMNVAPMVDGTPTDLPAGIGTPVNFTADFVVDNSAPGLSNFVTNDGNVIDADLDDYATMTTVLGGDATIMVNDNSGNTYNAGNFVGFAVRDPTILGLPLSLLSNITISTYNNNALRESRTAGSLLALNIGSTDLREVGFYTNQTYDEVRITFSGLAASLRVYYAFMRGTGSCTSPTLACNTSTLLAFPTHPVVAENATSAVLAIGGITNLSNMVDANANTAATMVPVASVLGSHGVSIKNTTGQYPIGTYIAFDIQNTSLLSASLLSRYSIELFNNDGSVLETIQGASFLANLGLLNSNRLLFGGVSTVAFDEARLVFNSTGLADVNLGATDIFGVYVKNLCEFTPPCDQTFRLVNPQFPVIINAERTGFGGVSVNGNIQNAENLIDADTTSNWATIQTQVGVLSPGSISVLDPTHTYEGGTIVGFKLAELSGGILDPVLNATLLDAITITTYNNGVEQESRVGRANLLDLNLLQGLLTLTTGTNISRIGFKTALNRPFDEVRISVAGVVSVSNELRIYAAQIGTYGTTNCPLPVTFGAVNSIFKNGALNISWESTTETNSKEFRVEASKDGQNWVTLETVASKAEGGNSSVAIQYSISKSLAGVALGGLGVMALLAMPFFRNRLVKGCLAVACLVLIGISCTKNNDQVDATDADGIWIRIVQVDKDGAEKVSSAVKTVVE